MGQAASSSLPVDPAGRQWWIFLSCLAIAARPEAENFNPFPLMQETNARLSE